MFEFPKTHRLVRRQEFQTTMSGGEKIVCPQFVMIGKHHAANESLAAQEGSRIGLIVSKKVGNAVVRNRVKRLLRESYRAMRPRLSGLEATDIVLIARPEAANASIEQISSAMQYSAKRLAKRLCQKQTLSDD